MFSASSNLALRVTINNKQQCPVVGYVEFEDGTIEAMYMSADGSIHSLDDLVNDTEVIIEYKTADGAWNPIK